MYVLILISIQNKERWKGKNPGSHYPQIKTRFTLTDLLGYQSKVISLNNYITGKNSGGWKVKAVLLWQLSDSVGLTESVTRWSHYRDFILFHVFHGGVGEINTVPPWAIIQHKQWTQEVRLILSLMWLLSFLQVILNIVFLTSVTSYVTQAVIWAKEHYFKHISRGTWHFNEIFKKGNWSAIAKEVCRSKSVIARKASSPKRRLVKRHM